MRRAASTRRGATSTRETFVTSPSQSRRTAAARLRRRSASVMTTGSSMVVPRTDRRSRWTMPNVSMSCGPRSLQAQRRRASRHSHSSTPCRWTAVSSRRDNGSRRKASLGILRSHSVPPASFSSRGTNRPREHVTSHSLAALSMARGRRDLRGNRSATSPDRSTRSLRE